MKTLPSTLKRSRGFTLIELAVVLVIVALLAGLLAKWLQTNTQLKLTSATATYMVSGPAAGVSNYTTVNHDALAANGASAVIKQPICGALAIQTGAAVANPLAPTYAELKAGGCFAYPNMSALTPQGMSWLTQIQLQNCPGSTCQIFGMAYTTTGLTNGETTPRYDLVAEYIRDTNGSGAASTFGHEGTLQGGGFSTPNPVTVGGVPVGGILAAGTFFNQGIFSNFVRINDTVDPNLQGNLTVKGNITGGGTIGTTDGVAACLRAAMNNSGQFIAKAANCLTRVFIDGNTGNVTTYDSTGRNAAGISYSGNTSTVYADNLQNNAGTAGIRSDGTVYGKIGQFGTINISNTATVGGACTTANDIVATVIGGNPALLSCQGGVWKLSGGTTAGTAGSACSVAGAPGISSTGVGLICQNGVWMNTTSRFGRFAATDNYDNVTDGTVIAMPTCSSGGTAKIYFIPAGIVGAQYPVSATVNDSATNFRVDLAANPGFFTAVVDDTIGYGVSKGNTMPGYTVAITGCYYN